LQISRRIWLELIIAFDFVRGFFEPFMAYRIGYLVIVKRRYRRPWTTTLKDGTILRRGDKIIRLHMKLFMPRFRGVDNDLSYSRYLFGLLAPEMPYLASVLRTDPAWADFKAIMGQSHVVGKYTEKLGFETRAIPDWWIVVVDLLGRGAMLLTDPTPRCLLKILKPHGVRKPRETWIGCSSLVALHNNNQVEPPRLRRLFKYF